MGRPVSFLPLVRRCLAEWDTQFIGDRAYEISRMEQKNLRWKALQFRTANLWYCWVDSYRVGSSAFDERNPSFAALLGESMASIMAWSQYQEEMPSL